MNVYKILNAINRLENNDEKILVETRHLKMLSMEISKLKLKIHQLEEDLEYKNKRYNLCKAERNNAIGKLAEKAYRELMVNE